MGNTATAAGTPRDDHPGALSIGYAPTNRASCKTCKNKIGQDALRIGRKVRSPFHDGFDTQYHHYRCGKRWASNLDSIQGWRALKWKDITKLMTEFGLGAPDESDPTVAEQKKHSDALWTAMRDVKKGVPSKLLKQLLDANEVPMAGLKGPDILARATDGLVFGALPLCPMCKTRGLVAMGDTVICKGWFSGATRCTYSSTTMPAREPWKIPLALTSNKFLRDWESPVGAPSAAEDDDDAAPAKEAKKAPAKAKGKGKGKAKAKGKGKGKGKAAASDSDSDDAAAATTTAASASRPVESDDEDVPVGSEMAGMQFAFIGKTEVPRKELQELITSHGGTFKNNIVPNQTTHLVAPESDVTARRKPARVKQAISLDMPIVSDQFVVDLAKREGTGIKLRQRKNFGDYLLGGGLGAQLAPLAGGGGGAGGGAGAGAGAGAASGGGRRRGTKRGRDDDEDEDGEEEGGSLAKRVRRRVVPGSAITQVDEDVALTGAKVYIDDEGTTAYTAMLTMTNLGTGENKFYKIQVLQKGKSYYCFTKWGRVGQSSYSGWGRENFRLKRFGSASGAIAMFNERFHKMTGQDWDDREGRQNFKQRPMKYDMIELDCGTNTDGDDAAAADTRAEKHASKLAEPVADFTRMIFDVTMMKKAMEAQNIDLDRMPLGSLSKRQLDVGYEILRSIQDTLAMDESDKKATLLLDASNRFYTTIPHRFSVHATPPVIKTQKQLKEKIDMLQSLVDVAVASNLMKENAKAALHPDDANYASLKCELTALDKKGKLFKMLKQYMLNTHAATHNSYTLEVLEIFEADRAGERDRFEPWNKLHNHQLLWHGSRLSNWVGIISQGLRIAPPEAPATGYMFGKGVYFANMVSKSANYCFTNPSDNIGVLMLCEVALGDTYNCLHSDGNAATNYKRHKAQSTWGQGGTTPDPKATKTLDDGAVKVPMGKGVPSGVQGSLLYDELIVYDTAQIKMRYIFKTKFNYKKSTGWW